MEKPERLRRVDPSWLEMQGNLRTLAGREHTQVFCMPKLGMQGAFRIAAQLKSIVLHYPGVSLDLLKRIEVGTPVLLRPHKLSYTLTSPHRA